MLSQDRKIITVAAQNGRLELDARGHILLIDQLPLRNDRIRQFHRRLVQKHQVNPLGVQYAAQVAAQAIAQFGGRACNQHAEIIVAEWAHLAACPRAETIRQAHLLNMRKIVAQGFKFVHMGIHLHMELYYTRQAPDKWRTGPPTPRRTNDSAARIGREP